jgi:hypothetical protein
MGKLRPREKRCSAQHLLKRYLIETETAGFVATFSKRVKPPHIQSTLHVNIP